VRGGWLEEINQDVKSYSVLLNSSQGPTPYDFYWRGEVLGWGKGEKEGGKESEKE
jgi:hypothetical protein